MTVNFNAPRLHLFRNFFQQINPKQDITQAGIRYFYMFCEIVLPFKTACRDALVKVFLLILLAGLATSNGQHAFFNMNIQVFLCKAGDSKANGVFVFAGNFDVIGGGSPPESG